MFGASSWSKHQAAPRRVSVIRYKGSGADLTK